jgi:hypothetical protein
MHEGKGLHDRDRTCVVALIDPFWASHGIFSRPQRRLGCAEMAAEHMIVCNCASPPKGSTKFRFDFFQYGTTHLCQRRPGAGILFIIQRPRPFDRLNRHAKEHLRKRKIGGLSFLYALQHNFGAFH